jgi:hypothetical protein
MVGDEDQEEFYENLPESNDFRKQQRDNEKSGRGGDDAEDSSSSDDSDAPEDECETPPEV